MSLIAIHDMQLTEHNGAGLRDGNLLESTVAKPEGVAAYGELYTAALAATHGSGISRNHALVNSNKRTALVAAELFLQLNGWRLEIDDAAYVLTMLAVTTGDITGDAFADWLRLHAHKKYKIGSQLNKFEW